MPAIRSARLAKPADSKSPRAAKNARTLAAKLEDAGFMQLSAPLFRLSW
ncbi:MAG TPA: hypothetical protein VFK50_11175 [Sphingomicrobium sp.]|nr:hypothetical protein [Sphingomicrobium sp.]